jgi:hypothetical protein
MSSNGPRRSSKGISASDRSIARVVTLQAGSKLADAMGNLVWLPGQTGRKPKSRGWSRAAKPCPIG